MVSWQPKFNVNQHTTMKENEISEEILLQTAKEIVIKFIDIGRITPNNFDASFKAVHKTIKETVRENTNK